MAEWRRPAFNGDFLSAHVPITGKSRPEDERDHGLIEGGITVHNQDEKKVMALSAFLMKKSKGSADE